MHDEQSRPKYVKTRVRKGDYIIPSNDASRLWRITRYDDSGWATHRYVLPINYLHEHYGDLLPVDFLDWDQWEYEEGGFAKLADAVASVVER